MSFLHPEFLYLTLPPVVVLFAFLLMQKEAEAHFFSTAVLEKLRSHDNALGYKARTALFFVVSLLIVLALAQPVIKEGEVSVQAKSADIMVAFDISDSMRAEDIYPSRLQRAKQKVLELLESAPDERIGVMAFAKSSYLVSPLSFDHGAVAFLVRQLKPSFITEQGTDFVQLLDAAAQSLQKNEEKYLLLLTDGGDQERFEREIALAKEKGLRVFILGIGTAKGAPIKLQKGGFVQHEGKILVSSLNDKIAGLATQTGGIYIESVASERDIEAMVEEIKGRTEQHTLKEEKVPMYTQLFYYPALLALLFLLLATSSVRRSGAKTAALLAAFWLGGQGATAEAGLLDFRLLDEAQQRYDAGDYQGSAELYEEYAKANKSAEARYDRANALYKQGQYAKAAELYEGVDAEQGDLAFNSRHNLGNAYAKQGDPESLQKALQAYEKALQIKEDQQTRENLEMVKEMLKQQQQDKGDRQQKDQDSSADTSEQEGKEKKQQGDEEQRPDGEQQQPGSQQSESREGAQPPQSQKSDKQEKSAQQQGAPQPGEQEGEQQPPAAPAKSEKPADREQPGSAPEAATAAAEPKMSDMEAAKWLEQLNENPVSHIYKIVPDNPTEVRENEKPW